MNINDYIRSELLILIPVLYIIGLALKKSPFNDKFIPLVLGVSGVVLSTLWVFSTGEWNTAQEVAIGIFTSVTQGILVAGASVYVNEICKQVRKKGKDE